jgi:hypothetical protein
MNFKQFVIQEDWRRTRNQLSEIDQLLGRLANRPDTKGMFDVEIDDAGHPHIVGINITPEQLRDLMIQHGNVRDTAAPRIAAMAMQKIRNNIRWEEDDPRAAPDAFRFSKPEDERVSY